MTSKYELSSRGLSMFIILSIVNTIVIVATAVIFVFSVVTLDTSFRYKCTEVDSGKPNDQLILCGK